MINEAELNAVTDRIAVFRSRLAQACAAAGRTPESVELIAVTKNFPVEYAVHAARCGLVNLGENKAQELAAKRPALQSIDESLARQVTWHFIGRLQRNKAKQAVEFADIIHSIDRAALANAVGKAATASERWSSENPLPVMLQVDLDPAREPLEKDSSADRGGVHPADVLALADVVASHEALRVRGVMAVAPLEGDPAECFTRLADVSHRLRAAYPDAVEISAGMTGDFPAAIANGATMVRVGTALFGSRTLTSNA